MEQNEEAKNPPPAFDGVDFDKIASESDFNETAVRARIIDPILKALGYSGDAIVYEKKLQNPILKTDTSKHPITQIPDYVLQVEKNCVCVLDAKSPKEKIINDENVEQVYSYAVHIEVRSPFFALCNGVEFALFETASPKVPRLYFRLKDMAQNWQNLFDTLSHSVILSASEKSYQRDVSRLSDAQHDGARNARHDGAYAKSDPNFDYSHIRLPQTLQVRKQAAKRHFGCNAYFTRQSWDVVQRYIENFTQKGDLVLDPFGGSGVTAIEALMTGRRAIHIDLNPMSVFMTEALAAPVNTAELFQAFERIKKSYLRREP